MEKRLLEIWIFLFFIALGLNLVSADTGVSLTAINSSYAQITISGADDLYAYEVNFDYTGTINSVTDSGFLSTGAGTATSSYNVRSSVLYVYSSRLDNAKTGIDGSGEIFNVSYSGTLARRYALFVKNDSTETYVYYNTTTPSVTPTGGGGTSGVTTGDGGGAAPKLGGLNTNPGFFNLGSPINVVNRGKIYLSNTGGKDLNITISIVNLPNIKFKETFFNLNAKGTKLLEFDILPVSEPGIYTGKIVFTSDQKVKEVPIALNIQSERALFDVSVDIFEEDRTIVIGNKIRPQVTLVQAGLLEKMDLTVNYVIKDFNGNTVLTQSETMMVHKQKTFVKDLETSGVPPGEYIVGVEVIYPGGLATASSQFSIIEEEQPFGIINKPEFLMIILFAAVVFVFIIAIVMFLIYRRSKRNKRRR